MKKNHFKNKDRSEKGIDEQVKLRYWWMEKFSEKYGAPVLVHSTPVKKNFIRILNDGKLLLPKQHGNVKKTCLMEEFIGMRDSIFFSLGFVYVVSYDFKYSFIFDLSLLKELEYYENPISWEIYKRFADYIYENDQDYFEILKSKSITSEQIVNRYLFENYKIKKRVFFDFWKDEQNIFNWATNYSDKKILKNIGKNTLSDLYVKYPYSKRFAKIQAFSQTNPEILSRKAVSLKSPSFLGFFILGKIPKDVETILKNNFKGKIIFNGKEIEVIE